MTMTVPGRTAVGEPGTAPLVEVRDLVVDHVARGAHGATAVRAVAGVSFEIQAGETFGLVGESGSGKTTLARAILRLVAATAGEIRFEGEPITTLGGERLRAIRRRMQVVYQDPLGSLDPRLSVADSVAEPLVTHEPTSRAERESRVRALLDDVGLGGQHLDRRPHELSGGQAQRVAIARALALRPAFVVLDEPTSALDVSVQAQILNLLADLRETYRVTYLLISHDLGVVRHLADRIAVMYLGRIVERGDAAPLMDGPTHPYTAALLASAWGMRPASDPESPAAVEIASPSAPPAGCRYHPRCRLREELGRPERCVSDEPALVPIPAADTSRLAACHFADHDLTTPTTRSAS